MVFIDWANVYGWRKSLKQNISPRKLKRFFEQYSEIGQPHFYYGTDITVESRRFLRKMHKLGYKVHTKPVKYIKVHQQPATYKKKCDFDLEIAVDTLIHLDQYDSFIFVSGDGDFAYLYEYLIKNNKTVFVIHLPKHLGREIWDMKKVYKVEITKLL